MFSKEEIESGKLVTSVESQIYDFRIQLSAAEFPLFLFELCDNVYTLLYVIKCVSLLSFTTHEKYWKSKED